MNDIRNENETSSSNWVLPIFGTTDWMFYPLVLQFVLQIENWNIEQYLWRVSGEGSILRMNKFDLQENLGKGEG